MRIREWMIGVAATILAAAMVWGSTRTVIDLHEKRLSNMESWKDRAADQLSRLDEKIDMLLEANGLTYKKEHGRSSQYGRKDQ